MKSFEFEIMSGTQYYSMGKTPRQTKFRAKTKDFDKMYWVVGDYSHVDDNRNNPFSRIPYNEKHYIFHYTDGDWNLGSWGYTEIYPHTVQEFTGIIDANGVEIYEGDIVRIYYSSSYDKDGTLTLSNEYNEYVVNFNHGAFCLNDKPFSNYQPIETYNFYVIGNVFDTLNHHLAKEYHADKMYDNLLDKLKDSIYPEEIGAAFLPFSRELSVIPVTEYNCGYNSIDKEIYIRFKIHGIAGVFICYMSLDDAIDFKYGCNFSGKNNDEMHTWDSNNIDEIINNIIEIMSHNE